jgi:hypothetical protein
MKSRFNRMTQSDIDKVIAELDRWSQGLLGSKVTWEDLERQFKYSRQSLQSKPKIKAAYIHAKESLKGGLVETKEKSVKESKQLRTELDKLKIEIEKYKTKEFLWMKRWQRIAFHIRQKGIQVESIDKPISKNEAHPSNTETAKIIKPFDKEIPPSGRI